MIGPSFVGVCGRLLRMTGASFAAAALSCVAIGCGGSSDETAAGDATGGSTGSPSNQRVVLYSSADDYVLRAVAEAYEASTGVAVEYVGDTEATKTTGLVSRVLAEQESPRADVWWSSEAFGTVRLAEAGALEAYQSSAEDAFEDGVWPSHLRDPGGRWYGFGERARVFVYATDRVSEPPRRLRDLMGGEWAGRVGMARPRFGTTRGQMAALAAHWGEAEFEAWLRALEQSGVRLYDGNATVVRKVWEGEIDVGLTDTDDVYVGQRNGWPVELAFQEADPRGSRVRLPDPGPMVMPNTAGLIAGGPNPEAGRAFLDWLLSGEAERVLAASDSRNAPVHPAVRAEFPELALPAGQVDLGAASRAEEAAMAVCARVFSGG